MLSRSEFDVMLALKKTPTASQRAIASECGMSLGTVNAVVKSLGDRGLVEGGTLTAEGEDELSPYKVRNAVIMAAGLSSRMAPLSYECPKGVLKVRGEVLIERQIRQLKEAGIDDITVVVGFKKEELFYLEDLFGVKIVVNTDYATRNNHATLFQVRDIIGNTYICSSDNYFASNPFERYVYDSYYAAVFEEGETDEYCLQTKGRDKRITGAVVGGSHSWVIMGHAYWTRDFTCDFMRFLSQEYHLTETVGKLWDDIFLEHADELRMYMRPYKKGEIREFDSLPAAGFRPAVHRERGLERARQHLRDAQLPARRHLERKAYQEGAYEPLLLLRMPRRGVRVPTSGRRHRRDRQPPS